ncbi:tRNA pseudouridine(55) synthase TruB [Litorimonas sp. WD9-15]|uniref:tRNA pseudouridine(55) synthase TruB n=1 Tax=Litorimonas sp. WD9-15 TaxID=3418716 RepID=UPI003D02C3CB
MDPNGRKRKKGNPVHGWVVLDKAVGIGSTPMVGKVRWLFQAQKAGHAGTLDPLASGILPIALGEATKTVPFMMDAAKSYIFEITWGESRTTQDAEGDVTATSAVRPTEADIRAALPEFTGEIEQVPPKFSAIKIDGKRAYDLARAGEKVEIKSRPVRVDRFELVETTKETARFEVDCGKGTYIRSLARDLAASLGACGYVTLLRRTRVGPFTLAQSITLDELEQMCDVARVSDGLHPVSTALDDIPVLAVTETDANHLKHGRSIVAPQTFTDIDLILAEWNDTPIALLSPRDGTLVPKRVFNIT